MTLPDEIRQRGITEVVHFTTQRGIVGVLASQELQSRYRLPQDKYLEFVLHVNSAIRPESAAFFDKTQNWLDYVNLSMSEINRRYLKVSQRWHQHASHIWWGILAFDAEIMTHEGVFFTTTNNSYEPHCIRAAGADGFSSLFAPRIQRKETWWVDRQGRAAHLPTCEQAEVLYPGAISTKYLRRIYVAEDEQQDQTRGWLREFDVPNVEVVVDQKKFLGQPN